jgi:hypothetical protein
MQILNYQFSGAPQCRVRLYPGRYIMTLNHSPFDPEYETHQDLEMRVPRLFFIASCTENALIGRMILESAPCAVLQCIFYMRNESHSDRVPVARDRAIRKSPSCRRLSRVFFVGGLCGHVARPLCDNIYWPNEGTPHRHGTIHCAAASRPYCGCCIASTNQHRVPFTLTGSV